MKAVKLPECAKIAMCTSDEFENEYIVKHGRKLILSHINYLLDGLTAPKYRIDILTCSTQVTNAKKM